MRRCFSNQDIALPRRHIPSILLLWMLFQSKKSTEEEDSRMNFTKKTKIKESNNKPSGVWNQENWNNVVIPEDLDDKEIKWKP